MSTSREMQNKYSNYLQNVVNSGGPYGSVYGGACMSCGSGLVGGFESEAERSAAAKLGWKRRRMHGMGRVGGYGTSVGAEKGWVTRRMHGGYGTAKGAQKNAFVREIENYARANRGNIRGNLFHDADLMYKGAGRRKKGAGTRVGAEHNPWLEFLKEARISNPHITMHEASKMYHSM